MTSEAAKFVNPDKEVATEQDVLDGAHEILAEKFSEMAPIRNWVRNFTMRTGTIKTTVKTKGKELDEKGVYQQFYDFEETVKKMSSTRTLAINRGEKEKILTVKVQVDPASVMQYCHFKLIDNRPSTEATAFIEAAYQDAYKRFIGPAIEREVRNTLTESAEEQSIKVFGQNLYNLLMQAPIKGKVVLGFDPAYRTGCKLAVVDENGKFLDKAVIYPHKPAPEKKRQAAASELIALLEKYHVTMIAIATAQQVGNRNNLWRKRLSRSSGIFIMSSSTKPAHRYIQPVKRRGMSFRTCMSNSAAQSALLAACRIHWRN